MDWAIRLVVVYLMIGEALMTYCLLRSSQFRDTLYALDALTLTIVVAWVVVLWPRCMWKAVRG